MKLRYKVYAGIMAVVALAILVPGGIALYSMLSSSKEYVCNDGESTFRFKVAKDVIVLQDEKEKKSFQCKDKGNFILCPVETDHQNGLVAYAGLNKEENKVYVLLDIDPKKADFLTIVLMEEMCRRMGGEYKEELNMCYLPKPFATCKLRRFKLL